MSTWDGQLLDEKETLESQVTTDTLLTLVLMKQYELDNSEREMAMTLYQEHGPSEIDVCMPPYGTQFVVRLVWGGGERSNTILGLVYEHIHTATHCDFVANGRDPCEFDNAFPVWRLHI